jgi:NADH-quinone oxidoreductase subunit J
MNPILFWVLAAVAVIAGGFVIGKRSPLGGALALAVHLVALAGLFAALSAAFLFIIQILVYAGAVVVLIVFVIMLLNLREEDLKEQAVSKGKMAVSALLCIIPTALVLRAISAGRPGIAGAAGVAPAGMAPAAVPSDFGHVETMADQIFTRYLLPFEVVSLILLVGIVGAVVLAKRGE